MNSKKRMAAEHWLASPPAPMPHLSLPGTFLVPIMNWRYWCWRRDYRRGLYQRQSLFVSTFFPCRDLWSIPNLGSGGIASTTEAGVLVESFRHGKLNQTVNSTIQKSLDDFAKAWQKAFQNIIDSGELLVRAPSASYIVSDARFGTFFSDLLKADPLSPTYFKPNNHLALSRRSSTLSAYVSSLDPGEIDTLLLSALYLLLGLL